MNRFKIMSSIAAASVIALGFASPATAASFSGGNVAVGPDNSNWVFNLGDFSIFNNEDSFGNGQVWDEASVAVLSSSGSGSNINCVNADLSDASDASGDKVLTCGAVDVDNGEGVLSVTAEWRFYAASKIVRQRLIVTNDTSSTIDAGQVVGFFFNAYQDQYTQLAWAGGILDDWSSAAPIPGAGWTTSAEDLTWATDDRGNENEVPVIKYAVGREDSAVLPADEQNGPISGGHGGSYNDASDQSYTFFRVPTLAAGETIEFVVLAQKFSVDETSTPSGALNAWETGTRDAIIEADEDTSLANDDVIFAGIDDRSRVVNWSPAEDSGSGAEPLANTGANETLGLLAIVAALGTVVLAVRRRVVS